MAPMARHRPWVSLRPSRPAVAGTANEKTKQAAEYIAKQLPPHAMGDPHMNDRGQVQPSDEPARDEICGADQ
jgi:hypothetical protein